MKVPIKAVEISTPRTKANSTERGGRKISDLQPEGQGSGIAEVVEVRLLKSTTSNVEPRSVGGVDSHPKTGGGNQEHHNEDRNR